MGLIKKFKKYAGGTLEATTGIGETVTNPRAAARVAQRGLGIASRVPTAVKKFGTTLAENVNREAQTPGTAGNRFMTSPLGQSYLPKPVQKGLSFLGAPTPRGFIRSNKEAILHPSFGNIAGAVSTDVGLAALPLIPSAGRQVAARGIAAATGRAAAGGASSKLLATTASKVLGANAAVQSAEAANLYRQGKISGRQAIATVAVSAAPFVGPKVAGIAGRGVRRALSTEGRAFLSSEAGKVKLGPKAAATQATKKAVAQEVGADIVGMKGNEFRIHRTESGAIHINDVPVADVISRKATVPGLTPSVVKSEGFTAAFGKVNRGESASITFRSSGGAAPPAAAPAAPKPPKAARGAMPIAEANTPPPTNTTPPPTIKKPKPTPKMPSAATAEATVIEPRQPSRTKSATRPGPVRTRKMTAEERSNFDQPTVAAQETVARSKPAVEVPKTATNVAPAETGGTTSTTKPKVTVPKSKGKAPAAPSTPAAAQTATVEGGQQTIRGEIRAILQQGKSKRGSFSSLARKYNVSRQRVSEITKAEAKRMNNQAPSAVSTSPTGATASTAPAQTSASSSTSAKPKPKVKTPAPTNSTPATPQASTPAAPTASTATQAPQPVSPTVSASPGVKVTSTSTGAAPAASPTGAGTSLASRITAAVYKHVPKKTLAAGAVAATGATVLSQRNNIGVPKGGGGELKGGLKAEDQWVNDIPDETLRENVKALFSVKYKQGDEGLRSLVEGLQAARQTNEFISDADLASPETSSRFSAEYQSIKKAIPAKTLGKYRPYDPNKNPDEAVLIENQAKQELLKRVRERQHKLLKDKVDIAYKKIVAQRKTEEERAKNR